MAVQRTITVHAFDDDRVHLALAHLGRLRQGRLMTLCGRLAVTALSPFAAAAAASQRCRTCFGKVDENGAVKAGAAPAKPKPVAKKPATKTSVATTAVAKAPAAKAPAKPKPASPSARRPIRPSRSR